MAGKCGLSNAHDRKQTPVAQCLEDGDVNKMENMCCSLVCLQTNNVNRVSFQV